jgi:hypothetical protein
LIKKPNMQDSLKPNHTCSGESENNLFPIVNVMCGILEMLLQFINDSPTGFGSLSQSFHSERNSDNEKACEFLVGKIK